MTHLQRDIACCISVLFILRIVNAETRHYINVPHRALENARIHLPEEKFGINEYSEDTDNDERDKGSLTSQWDEISGSYHNGRVPKIITDSEIDSSSAIDKNIVWQADWDKDFKFGQISAVSLDPNGNVGIFHRGSRIWGTTTFDNNNRFDPNEGPIQENTIILVDKSGKKVFEWGKNMFYLPHGLTIDSNGNYWITDVAMHQVFKFDAKDIAAMRGSQRLKKREYNKETALLDDHNSNSLSESHVPKPSLILGEAFQPGTGRRFCKPTAVAVQSNGDFFVSDGYCNSRVIKFNAKGEQILQWGRHWGDNENMYTQAPLPYVFLVPHALALASESDLIFVADRENGRVVSFYTNNGTFHKEYKHPAIGTKVYSVAYAKERLYLVNGPDPNSMYKAHVRGFVVDVHSGDLLSQFWTQHDLNRPHDIAVTEDGSEIYVAELDVRNVYKFTQLVPSNSHHEPAPLRDSNSNDPSTGGTTTATLVLSLFTAFIALCVAIAAVIARCQKRGCLLIMRKRMRWEAERRENFKLSSLLESRRGKNFKVLEKRPNPRDFSKLNTEPETSEDEHPENSLAKVI